jgi:hypothetical protein
LFSFLSFIEIVEFFYKFFPFPGKLIYDVISFQKFSFSEVEQRQLTVDMESGWGKMCLALDASDMDFLNSKRNDCKTYSLKKKRKGIKPEKNQI